MIRSLGYIEARHTRLIPQTSRETGIPVTFMPWGDGYVELFTVYEGNTAKWWESLMKKVNDGSCE